MEICLNTNFSAIENYDLENINGGKSWWKVAAIGIGAVAVCWCPVIGVGAWAYGMSGWGAVGLASSVAGAGVSSMASGYSK